MECSTRRYLMRSKVLYLAASIKRSLKPTTCRHIYVCQLPLHDRILREARVNRPSRLRMYQSALPNQHDHMADLTQLQHLIFQILGYTMRQQRRGTGMVLTTIANSLTDDNVS